MQAETTRVGALAVQVRQLNGKLFVQNILICAEGKAASH